jgi:hypothetical protein
LQRDAAPRIARKVDPMDPNQVSVSVSVPEWDGAWSDRKIKDPGAALTSEQGLIGNGLPAMAAASTLGKGHPISPGALTLDDLKAIMNPPVGEPGALKDADARTAVDDAATRSLPQLNEAFKTMGIDTVEAQALYLAHAYAESGKLTNLTEQHAEKRPYAPFVGRGPLQVTDTGNYLRGLAYLQVQADQLTAQGGRDAEVDLLREAVVAIKRDITEAANPKYAFLMSAAMMHGASGVRASDHLGATAAFAGNGAADSWMTGRGAAAETFAETEARAKTERPAAQAALTAAEAATPQVPGDIEAARKRLKSIDATLNDMTSTIRGSNQKSAAYARAHRVLTARVLQLAAAGP